MSLTEIVSAVITLTLVMDPLGNIPLFISVLKNVKEEKRKRIIIRELFIALGLMLFFLFFGKWIVTLFSMDIVSLSVSGGIVLFLIALSMIFPSKENSIIDPKEEPFIVPLAIPLIAGPSVLSMILIYNMKDPGNIPTWFLIVIISWLINVLILSFSSKIAKFLGEKGMNAIERLMGMVLITISVQMILNGIKKFIYG
ncbi:MAG TPA: MarC family protein [Elusimicrobiales bacterium]|nr:MarC family protein [Elusimicrobiales bacterium]HOL63617.1 MarC family protein [Elusimicrobiales bacterium]HPO95617.1 MarC family protein [Elusimicrobiales bacterium]